MDNKIPILTSHHDNLEFSQPHGQRHTHPPNDQDRYETILPRWRAAVRARILSSVERESQILARMQARFNVYHLKSVV